MIVATIFFFLFAGMCVASGFMVIAARNPVHSVLFLILAFVNAAGLFVMCGGEVLAMILIVVYVGALAVLFLFVASGFMVIAARNPVHSVLFLILAFVNAAGLFVMCG